MRCALGFFFSVAVVFSSLGFLAASQPARGSWYARAAPAPQQVAAQLPAVPATAGDAASPADEWRTSAPKTYCMDYEFGELGHLGNAQYAAQIAACPPQILHVHMETAFNPALGSFAMSGWRGSPPPDAQARVARAKELVSDVQDFVRAMHKAGVEVVMPYQSSVSFFGEQQKRTGLWNFYDHWDDFAEFAIGPRPATDPAEWIGDGEDKSESLHWPCINHPDWRALLRMTTAWAARVGYNAVFSDINAHRCYRPSCETAFRKYLCAKYPPGDLKRLFGLDGPQQVRLGKEGEGLLWVETQRFRGHSFLKLFRELTAAGRQYVPDFFILPNASSYADIDEMWTRRRSGQNIAMWAQVCPIFMYEKNEQPGRFGRTGISDSIFQYKFAFANHIRAGMLLYNSQEPHSTALSNAEAAALGGGSFIQQGFNCPDVRMTYRRFFESGRDLLGGYSPCAQVAVAFFYDELFWLNRAHLEQVFCLKDYLCNRHVLWDLVVPNTFTAEHLAKYAVIIIPDLRHLSDRRVALLRQYADAGGGVVLIGEAGRFTDEGRRRKTRPFADVLGGRRRNGIASARWGRGWILHAQHIEDLIERPAFEIFELTEDQANETETIIRMAAEAEATKKPRGKDRLLALCQEMTRQPLSVAGKGVPFALRVFAYWRRNGDSRRMTVHLLNYDVPIRGRCRSGPPVPAENISLSIPLPPGWRPSQVRLRGPQAVSGAFLPFELKHGRLLVTVPRVEVYELIEVVAE